MRNDFAPKLTLECVWVNIGKLDLRLCDLYLDVFILKTG